MKSRFTDIYSNLSNLKSFEFRQAQVEISKIIEKSLYESQDVVIEAGTGIGKSIAYLLPSILFSLENEQKIVISTETKSLQEQIKNKDIPLAMEILQEKELITETAMGSSNYICKRKYQNFIDDNIKKSKKIVQFDNWIEKTKTGFIQEYPQYFDEIKKFVRDPNDCFGRKCPNFSSSYYFVAKKKWENADILVVNHSLLSTHIASDFSVLPKFSHLIIDEGHNFPEILCQAFRRELNFEQIKSFLDSLDEKKRGLITKLSNENLSNLVENSKENLRIFFQNLNSYFGFLQTASKKIREPLDIDNDNFEKSLLELHNTIYKEIQKNIGNEIILVEIQKKVKILENILESLRLIREVHDETTVFWAEFNHKFPTIFIQRIDSDYLISHLLKDKLSSIIFISATLSTANQNFQYFNKQVGIPKIKNYSFPSPFPYEKNSILYFTTTLPTPQDKNQKLYKEEMLKEIVRLVFLTEGNAFILFTSKELLKTTYLTLRDIIPYPIFSQIELGPIRAKEEFLKNANSILMGVSTFWQGIDIKGEKLKLVILTKLPFQVPDDPVFQYKAEALDKRNQNSFLSLQLPNACIILKQGFGRLIRAKNDKGIVAILDSRVYKKSYGRYLLESLPPSKRIMYFDELKEEYSKF